MATPPDQPDVTSVEFSRRHFEADCQFNAALAAFQAIVQPVPTYDLANVVAAAKPAFELGFCYLIRTDVENVEVLLRHSSGSEEISWAPAESLCSPALMLAGLLGIPMATPDQAPEPEQHDAEPLNVQPELNVAVASEPEPDPEAMEPDPEAMEPDLMGPDSPAELPGTHPTLRPLSADEIEAAVGLIKVMSPAARKSFTIHFRNAFNVPDTVTRIAGEITQLRHLQFIDAFNIEAAGGIAA